MLVLSAMVSKLEFRHPSLLLRLLTGLGFVCAFFGPLRADIVHLKNGQSIEGEVSVDASTGVVSVRKANGVVLKLTRDRVARITRKKSAAAEFRERLERIGAGSEEELEDLVRLAVFAREKRLRDELRRACRRILRIDPNHELARRELGYVVFENSWILESELARNRSEKGLVKFRGEWMSLAEKESRLRAEAREKIEDLLQSVATDNRYVQEFAIREIMAYRGPQGRAIFAAHIEDPSELVRIVSISALINFRSTASTPEGDPEARVITARLFRRLMNEGCGAKERQALNTTLRIFQPRESFRLALWKLQSSPPEWETRRAIEMVRLTLRKAWVPTLCRGLVTVADGERVTHDGVREALRTVFRVDHGFDVDEWLRWWRANEERYRDED